METDWTKVSIFFNEAINEKAPLQVDVSSGDLGQTLYVQIPSLKVEDFMKSLPLFEAEVKDHISLFENEVPEGGRAYSEKLMYELVSRVRDLENGLEVRSGRSGINKSERDYQYDEIREVISLTDRIKARVESMREQIHSDQVSRQPSSVKTLDYVNIRVGDPMIIDGYNGKVVDIRQIDGSNSSVVKLTAPYSRDMTIKVRN